MTHAGTAAQPRHLDVDDLLDELLDEAREHAARRGLEREQRDRVAALGRPTYELTRRPEGIDTAGLYVLAADLRRQGMA